MIDGSIHRMPAVWLGPQWRRGIWQRNDRASASPRPSAAELIPHSYTSSECSALPGRTRAARASPATLTEDELWALLGASGGRCAVTGVTFSLESAQGRTIALGAKHGPHDDAAGLCLWQRSLGLPNRQLGDERLGCGHPARLHPAGAGSRRGQRGVSAWMMCAASRNPGFTGSGRLRPAINSCTCSGVMSAINASHAGQKNSGRWE
jgi:hypothetical protein